MGLNDSYKATKAQVLLIKPFLNLNEVYSIIRQEKNRRQISTNLSIPNSMALTTRGTFSDAMKKNGTTQRKYYYTFFKTPRNSLDICFKANPNKPVCSHCRILGDTVDKCFETSGYPPGHKLHGNGSSSVNLVSLPEQRYAGNSNHAQLPVLLKSQSIQCLTISTSVNIQILKLSGISSSLYACGTKPKQDF